MASPDFAEFGRPALDTGRPGMVICLDCRGEVAKSESQFEAREGGYICYACRAARRRRFLAKLGAVAVATGAAIVWLVVRVMLRG